MKIFQRIILATDFSPASTPAFEQSVKMAKQDDAQLLIAHAYMESGLVELSQAPARVAQEWDQKLREGVERKLQPLVEHARKEGVEATALLLTGFADEAITEAPNNSMSTSSSWGHTDGEEPRISSWAASPRE